MTRLAIAATVIVVALAAGCGSSSSVKASTNSPSAPAATTTSAAVYNKCNRQIGKWMTALKALDSRLNIGLVNSDYTKELGNVSVLYGQIDFKAMSPQCLTPGVKAEDAFNDYIHASNAWSKCISSVSCTNAKMKPKLQAFWAAAAAELTKAQNDLQKLRG